MTTYPEERVLKPLDPIPDDVNAWPDFALREVKIFPQGKGRYADLLDAADDFPLCVLGELMPLEEDQEHLSIIEDPLYLRIKIENVTNYSFGQNEEGKPVVWAAGKAGWFEISPADKYLSYYNDIIEAIDLFYFMVDQYQQLPAKRKRLGFQIDPFLKAYQKHTDYRIDDDDEAMEILHKHHKFLLKQMIEEREDIDWSQTHLWNHLVPTYSDIIQAMRAKIRRHAGAQTSDRDDESSEEESEDDPEPEVSMEDAPAEASNSETEESSEDDESAASPHTSAAAEDSSSSSTEEQPDYTKLIWSMLNVLRKMPTFDIKTAGIEQIATEFAKLTDGPGTHKGAVAALERSAEPLLRLMHEAKLRKKFNWSTRAIWAELEATLADEIAEEIRTPAPRTSNKKHRLKSVLRPSGAGKASKRTTSRVDEEDEDSDMMIDPPMHSNMPAAKRQQLPNGRGRARGGSSDSGMDSPSRQLNGHLDAHALPELPPAPEAQEMIDLVKVEAKRVGRINQVNHLEAFLGNFNGEFL